VAFDAVTVKVDDAPALTEVGLAAMMTVGAGLAVTVKAITADAFPPIPDATAV
jgi:hypothetical protein